MTTVNLLAPAAYAQFQAKSGTFYTADAYGEVKTVALGDVLDLLNSGCIFLGQTGFKNNSTTTVDPATTNDNTQDYGIGSRWLNNTTGLEWVCQAATTNAAVWLPQISTGVLLGRIIGANMNVTTDQAFVMTNWAALNTFRITKITAKNASTSLTTAAGGIYTATSKGGTAIVANTQVYSALTSASLAVDLTIATTPAATVQAKGVSPILSLTTAQGTAATADLYLFGDVYC